ncbi:hypothetical protein HK105_203456 [Polyrhizophydium stewartii]|uniref:DUF7223 domain-containing protein n=1 Tax=Polyrhizophydium stewartii TaxID=2732419 RepID=A0ABR4NC11_9FUNG|nr:hypothetical protein HK105_001180 [Polyrhizophydium stewartii]
MRPIHSDNKPSESSVAKWYDTTLGEHSPTVAGMSIVASVPSVNLDNVPGLSTIRCTNDAVTVNFASLDEVQHWKVEKTLLLIAARHNCGAGGAPEFTMRLATNWAINAAAKSLEFATTDPEAAGVTGTFDLVAVPVSNATSYNSTASSNSTRPGYKSNSLDKRFDTTLSVPLNIDKDINQQVSFPIANVGTLSAGCAPCGIHGASTAAFNAKGKLFKKPNFTLSWSGSVRAEAKLVLNANVQPGVPPQNAVLFDLPINAINIAGVLVLGPEISLSGRADAVVLGTTGVTADFTASMPNFSASISNVDGKSVTGFTPVFGFKTDANANFDAELKLGLTPKIAVVARVFGFDLGHTSLSLDATADLKFGAKAGAGAAGSTDPKGTSTSAGASVCFSADAGLRIIGELVGFTKDLFTLPPKTIIDKCAKTA